MFGLIFLTIIAILNNSAPDNQDEIQDLFDRISCPMPSQTGLWNSSGTLMYEGGTYNYPNVSNQTLTLTCTEIHTLNGVDYYFGQPTVAIGVFFYVGDYISELFSNKAGAILEMIGFILSPASFSFLGFGIEDLSGVALMAVIGIYLLCYISIGVMIYKFITPFAG